MDNGKISRKPVPYNKKKAKWPDHSALIFGLLERPGGVDDKWDIHAEVVK